MEVHLTPAQNEFVQSAIQSGRYRSAEEVVREALAGWEQSERVRTELAVLLQAGDEDLAAGNITVYTDDTLPQLADEIMAEGRAYRAARLAGHVQPK